MSAARLLLKCCPAGLQVFSACKRAHRLLPAAAEELPALSRQLHGHCTQEQQTCTLSNVRSAVNRSTCFSASVFQRLGLKLAISQQVLPVLQGQHYLQQQHLALSSLALQQHICSQQFMGIRTRAGDHPIRGKAATAETRHQPTSRSTKQQPTQLDSQHHQHHQQPQQEPQQRSHQPSLEHHGLSPSRLNRLICSASTPRELLECVVYNHQLLNRIHIRTAIVQASKMWLSTAVPAAGDGSSSSSVTTVERQQLHKLMLQLSGPFVRTLPDCSANEIAAVMKAYAVCNVQPPGAMVDACVQDVISWDKLQQAQPMALVKLTWAAAYMGCRDQQLYSRAAAAALNGHVQQYTPAQVSTMAWACAKAGYSDNTLGLALTARAVELLQRQLRQGAADNRKGRKAQQQDAAWKFQAGHLSSMLWGSTVGGWLSQTPELMQLSAALAVQEPFVYDFSMLQASNFVWSFASSLVRHTPGSNQRTPQPSTSAAAAAGAAAEASAGTVDEVSLKDGHDSGPDGHEAAAGSQLLDAAHIWQSNLRVVTCALRQPVLASDAVSLSRLVWSLGALYGWVDDRLEQQQHVGDLPYEARLAKHHPSPAEQRALADGVVVFDQLCAAHARLWQRHSDAFPKTAAMTAWGLVAAGKHHLWQMSSSVGPLLQPEDTAAPMQLLQALLKGIQQSSEQLYIGAVADLLKAMEELKPRLNAQVMLIKHRHKENAIKGTEREVQAQEVDAAVADTLPVQLQSELTSAVAALTAAAHRLVSTEDSPRVYHVSRILSSLCELKVQDEALCILLLQHLNKDALEGCSIKALGMALHAAATWVNTNEHVIATAMLPASFWEQLIAVGQARSRALKSTQYSNSVDTAVRSLTATLKRVVARQESQQEYMGPCEPKGTA